MHRLVHAAYAKWAPLIGRAPIPMTVDYADVIGRHRFDLLFDKQNLVALIETRQEEDCFFIENLCVSPEHQRKGLARSLLKHAETLATEAGYSVLRLDTNALFAGNVELYQRMGYETEWEKPITGGVHVRMRKILR